MTTRPRAPGSRRGVRRTFVIVATVAMIGSLLPAAGFADEPFASTDDPRVGLGAGAFDAETAAFGLDLVGQFDKREGGFWDPASLESSFGGISTANSDLAFKDGHAFQGNWRGFQIFDISDPTNPQLRTEVVCPGGQGDPNVFGNLLFISVEDVGGRVDCGTEGAGPLTEPNPDRFRGVRIFDISDLDNPVHLGGVQTCRGSHTHRVVEDLSDPSTIYIYNSGTQAVRSGEELEGCQSDPLTTDPFFDEDSSIWQVEVIEVPLDQPQDAQVIDHARLFADETSGALNGLQNTQFGALHPSGIPYSPLPNTNTCHDITVYPEIGLAAGACQGNGLLIDISDPADPQRIDAVADPNFSYWHSANFNNDGTAVMFTDEWGGGTAPRCRATDRLSWGANALFEIDRSGDTPRLEFASYYKMPAAQSNEENCVAHQANIVPVPGRDILVQAWYQGGVSMFDWTDPANPFELAYFDRGPIREDLMVLGGFWNAYWFNGAVFGTEIARGLDAFELTPTEYLTANEIAAANTVTYDQHNPMALERVTWEPSAPVVLAFRDQAVRDGLSKRQEQLIGNAVERVERFQDRPGQPAARQALEQLRKLAGEVEGAHPALADALHDYIASKG